MVAEARFNDARLWDIAHRDDLAGVSQMAVVLGIGNLSADGHPDPALRQWAIDRYKEAGEILSENDAKAWRLVTAYLSERGHLTGDEVRHLVDVAGQL